MPAERCGPAEIPSPAEGETGGRLPPERIAEMRALVEGSTLSYRRIGAELGLAAATVWRYAADGQWRRPPDAGRQGRIARHRDKTTEKLWKLAARHAATLEEQDPEVTRQSLQPLASLTRALGTLSPKPGPGPAPEEEPPPERPPRSIHELRDELAAHLARIDREEAEWWDRHAWHFEHGAGI
ncbi:hypothetical protein DES45_106372 [Microvirga subterranea]|uniref:Uncharacterized protein n=2 Tax=Microvirga subterranea TaxID=186651 RepID=A0A370HIM9_9HYPH|nr:hypothetical protein DES45_106372 [Microvirga subterranea]